MHTTLTTAAGRRLTATVDTDWERGLTFYAVDRIGAFTVDWEPYGYPKRQPGVRVQYGRVVDRYRYSYDYAPEAPVLFGVTLGGASVFDAEQVGDDGGPGGSYWWLAPPRRFTSNLTSETVPDGTHRRAAEIVAAVARHWLDRADQPALLAAHQRRHAPARLQLHQHNIDRLREKIANAQAELDREVALADVQVAILGGQEAPRGAA